MSTRQIPLSKAEIARMFDHSKLPPTMLAPGVAGMLGLSVKTIYTWVGLGRLKGCYRKRGKHLLFFTERTVNAVFNGPEWDESDETAPEPDTD